MIIRLLSHIVAKGGDKKIRCARDVFRLVDRLLPWQHDGKVYHNKDLLCGAKKTLFFMAHSQRRSEGQNGFSQIHVGLRPWTLYRTIA